MEDEIGSTSDSLSVNPVQMRSRSIGRVRLEHALLGAGIHVKSLQSVISRLKRMSLDGPEKFQIITDFDMTLTKYHVNGTRGFTSHAVCENSSQLPPSYRKKAKEIKEKYYPMEISHSLTKEEKIPLMIEWWSCGHQLLIDYKLKREDLKNMVENANISLRPGCNLLFDTADKYRVPVLIFSAGLSNIIEEIISQRSTFYPVMRILANDMKFHEDGNLIGFSEPLVHTFNKPDVAEHHKQVFEEVKDRSNVLLLGDSTGDPHIADAFEAEHQLNIVKIGFLNYKENELLEKYKDLYDIVLTGDPSMDLVNALIFYVLDQHAHAME